MRDDYIKIIKEHKGIIYKVTKIYTDTPEDQQDLYQEILYQLWRSFESFKNNSKVSTWIYKVALNTSIAHLSQQKKYFKHTEVYEIIHQNDDKHDSIQDERIEQMYQMIKKLNEGERGLILLYLEGKKHEEMASITGFSVSNVGTKINRIIQKMKSQITK